LKKAILLPVFSLLLINAYTQIKAEVKQITHKEIGLTTWTYHNKNKLELVNNLDTIEIKQTGDLYFETTRKKYIAVQSKGAKQFTILPDKTLRRINISNYLEDNTAIISVIKGKAQVQYNNDIYTVREGYTMTINKNAVVNENEDVRSDTAWICNNLTIEDQPIYIIINKVARSFGYKTTFAKKPENHLMFSIDIGDRNIKTMLDIINNRYFNYKIQGNNIIIY
jgi:hypothetical protein